MNWQACALTDRGRVRKNNEDTYSIHPEHGVFVLADGMGGHAAGEIASALAVETVSTHIVHALEELTATTPDGEHKEAGTPRTVSTADDREEPRSIEEATLRAIEKAHDTILDHTRHAPETIGMGTTLITLTLQREAGTYLIGHVGDSRAYLIRGEQIDQLTTDHTLAQEKIDQGQLTRAEATSHLDANVLTRAVGTYGATPTVDTIAGRAQRGDTFLLCSDGLTGVVGVDEICETINTAPSIETATHRLIQIANENGGPDNITVILVRITS